jgi:hypothetical protein
VPETKSPIWYGGHPHLSRENPFGLLASVARMVNKLRVLDRIAERRFRRILGTQIAQNRSILGRTDPEETTMNRVLLSLAAAGLLFSTPAFSQNTDTKTPSTNAPAATTTVPVPTAPTAPAPAATAPITPAPAATAKPSRQNQAAPSGERRELSGPNDRTERNGERSERRGDRSERRGERGHRHHWCWTRHHHRYWCR